MFKLPTLPRSAAELDDFQFAVENTIMVVSGRHNRRLKWIIATIHAKDPSELDRASRKLMSLDIKLSVACLAACATHSHLNDILRQAGPNRPNDSGVCDGRQRLWRIYKYFAVPNLANQGLGVTFAAIDFAHIKLIGGNAGLGKFWNKRRKCVARIKCIVRRRNAKCASHDGVCLGVRRGRRGDGETHMGAVARKRPGKFPT
jgi:hypothetical protein